MTAQQNTHFKFTLPILKTRTSIEKNKDGADVEVRYVEGVASSTDLDLHGDRMDASAIKSMADSLKYHLIRLNADHDTTWSAELGDISKLDVSESNQLLIEAKLNDMSKANDLWLALTEMDKKLGLSIGGYVKEYEMVKEDFQNEETGEIEQRWVKHYKNIELDHIAVTSSPANPKTWVGAIAKSIEKESELTVKKLEEDEAKKLADEQAEKDKRTKKFKDLAHEIVKQIQNMEANLLLELTEKALYHLSSDQLSILETNLSMVQKNSLEADKAEKAETTAPAPATAVVETPATPETEVKPTEEKVEEAKSETETAPSAPTADAGGETTPAATETKEEATTTVKSEGAGDKEPETKVEETVVVTETKVEEPVVTTTTSETPEPAKVEEPTPAAPTTEKNAALEPAAAELLKSVSDQLKQFVELNETLTKRVEELEKQPAGRKTVEELSKGIGDTTEEVKDPKTLKKEMDAKIAEAKKTHAGDPNLFSMIQRIRAEYSTK